MGKVLGAAEFGYLRKAVGWSTLNLVHGRGSLVWNRVC